MPNPRRPYFQAAADNLAQQDPNQMPPPGMGGAADPMAQTPGSDIAIPMNRPSQISPPTQVGSGEAGSFLQFSQPSTRTSDRAGMGPPTLYGGSPSNTPPPPGGGGATGVGGDAATDLYGQAAGNLAGQTGVNNQGDNMTEGNTGGAQGIGGGTGNNWQTSATGLGVGEIGGTGVTGIYNPGAAPGYEGGYNPNSAIGTWTDDDLEVQHWDDPIFEGTGFDDLVDWDNSGDHFVGENDPNNPNSEYNANNPDNKAAAEAAAAAAAAAAANGNGNNLATTDGTALTTEEQAALDKYLESVFGEGNFDPMQQGIEEQRDQALQSMYESMASRGMSQSGAASASASDIYRKGSQDIATAREEFRQNQIDDMQNAAAYLFQDKWKDIDYQQQQSMAQLMYELEMAKQLGEDWKENPSQGLLEAAGLIQTFIQSEGDYRAITDMLGMMFGPRDTWPQWLQDVMNNRWSGDI